MDIEERKGRLKRLLSSYIELKNNIVSYDVLITCIDLERLVARLGIYEYIIVSELFYVGRPKEEIEREYGVSRRALFYIVDSALNKLAVIEEADERAAERERQKCKWQNG